MIIEKSPSPPSAPRLGAPLRPRLTALPLGAAVALTHALSPDLIGAASLLCALTAGYLR